MHEGGEVKFEGMKRVIRRRKSKKDRQHSGQKKKYKGTNNELLITTQKTKDRATRAPLQPVVNSGAPKG